jgi:ribosomal protein S18 acetylase RimI-like enzyme
VRECAALAAAREGDDAARWVEVFRRRAEADPVTTFVARVAGEVAGYGSLGWLDSGSEDSSISAPADPSGGPVVAPTGWYLTGLVVDPSWRRRGVGVALTAHRLDWLRGRAEVVYYFANARNRATIDLHRRLGFEEVTRDFAIPGVAFAGGVGVLYWAQLRGAEASGTAGP